MSATTFFVRKRFFFIFKKLIEEVGLKIDDNNCQNDREETGTYSNKSAS